MADATYDIVTALKDILGKKSIRAQKDLIAGRNVSAVGGRLLGDGAVPTGSIILSGAPRTLPGFLECDGSSVDPKVYPDLYNVIGTTFGYTGTFTDRTITSATATSNSDIIDITGLVPFGDGNDDEVSVLTADSASVISSRSDSGVEKWRAFDGATSTYWKGLTTDSPCYLGYNFGTGKTIRAYSIRCNAFYTEVNEKTPSSWTFEGSNNGTTWTVLHQIDNFDFDLVPAMAESHRRTEATLMAALAAEKKLLEMFYPASTVNSMYKAQVRAMQDVIDQLSGNSYAIFAVENSGSYQYYRINITKASSGTEARILDFALMSGDVVSSAVSNLTDGVKTTAWSSSPNPTSDQVVTLDCVSSVVVDAYKFCGQYNEKTLAFAPDRWMLEGSTNASTWVFLAEVNDAKFDAADTDFLFKFSNSTAYRYYRFTFPASSIGIRVVLHGIELLDESVTGFCVPDLQDYFIRGWDHSRSFGGTQDDAMQGHIHLDGYHQLTATPATCSRYGVVSDCGDSKRIAGSASLGTVGTNGGKASTPHTDGTNGTPRTDDETRPKNVALMYIIKT